MERVEQMEHRPRLLKENIPMPIAQMLGAKPPHPCHRDQRTYNRVGQVVGEFRYEELPPRFHCEIIRAN